MRRAHLPEELKPRSLLILLFLLVPSAAYLWRHDDLPQFGDLHDDGLYYVSAKSLAGGQGYRIESLPGEPAQTRYPPLYPLLLSIAWRIDPVFPHNLPIAAWISWLAFPAVLLQLAAYYPRLGISGARAWILLCLIAINPYAIFFSGQLLSEVSFLALALSTLLLVERAVDRRASKLWPAAAGVAAGLAYLTQSLGIVLLAAALVYFWLRRERAKSWYFALAMSPFIAGWMGWVHLHRIRTGDAVLLYYTDSFRYWLDNVSLRGAPLLLWKNLENLLWALGSLIQPRATDGALLKILPVAMAVAMIAGVARMVRRGQGVLYTIFAAGSVLVMLLWYVPPSERSVLPLFPLALAGLWAEIEHWAAWLKTGLNHKNPTVRIAAGSLTAMVIAIFAGSVALQIYRDSVSLPDDAHERRLAEVDRVAGYGWIRAHVPAEASILASDDPAVFLYTGRHAISRPVPPWVWYQLGPDYIMGWLMEYEPYARAHNLTYFEFSEVEPRSGLGAAYRGPLENMIRVNPYFERLYWEGPVTISRLR